MRTEMKLFYDDTSAGSGSVQLPTWNDVVTAIQALNGRNRSEVGLFVNDETYLQVGGGAGTYICSIRCDGKLHVLFTSEKDPHETQWVLAGQGSDYPVNECVPIEPIIDVAEWFYLNHEPSQRYSWKSY
jgi:hypothetical protein